MTRRASGATEWEIDVDQDDEAGLGPEDYAWLSHFESGGRFDGLPPLAWIWDRNKRELTEHFIAVAVRGPVGSA